MIDRNKLEEFLKDKFLISQNEAAQGITFSGSPMTVQSFNRYFLQENPKIKTIRYSLNRQSKILIFKESLFNELFRKENPVNDIEVLKERYSYTEFLKFSEAENILRVKRDKLRKIIKKEKFERKKIGTTHCIKKDEFINFLEKKYK